jgi:hypothetical protein
LNLKKGQLYATLLYRQSLGDHFQLEVAVQPKGSAPVTLYLKDFPVSRDTRGRIGSDVEDDQYMVNVSLTAWPDSSGFVVDNRSFISFVQMVRPDDTNDRLAKSIVRLSRGEIGDRLVGVHAEVRTPHDQGRAVGQWGTLPAQFRPKQGSRVISLKRLSVNAQLVDDAICGGYDGSFEGDLDVLYVPGRDFLNEREVRYVVQQSFSGSLMKASCEELTAGMVHAVVGAFKGQARSVASRVYNLTGFAETIWSFQQEVPSFPRPATKGEIKRTEERRRPSHQRTRASC